MYSKLRENIQAYQQFEVLCIDRKAVLQPLIDYIQQRANNKQSTNLLFVCTHNSRRSHLAQIWAQTAAVFYNIENVNCYSGGTEETFIFFRVIETLHLQGFQIIKIATSNNPAYAIKFDENERAIIGFSKKYDHSINPVSQFAAIMTCSQADVDCPFIAGAEKRIPITFEDPKLSDGAAQQDAVYVQRSIEIANQMMYVFSKIVK